MVASLKKKSPMYVVCGRFFVTLPIKKSAKLLRLGKKRNEFLCFALDFS